MSTGASGGMVGAGPSVLVTLTVVLAALLALALHGVSVNWNEDGKKEVEKLTFVTPSLLDRE
jgi:hypothetical protein